VQKLVTPRLIATMVMLPLLTIVADFIGLIGGYIVAKYRFDLAFSLYWTSAWQVLQYNDLAQGLIKPFAFAIIIAMVGCFYGIRTSGGTEGVGRSTTKAVVVSSIWIFVVTFFIAQIFVNLQ
jgi:phospholipid/cholesterol/gamma-HCH transport system permease protein